LAERRALVTGASGFIGSHLARRLLADEWEVLGVVRDDSDPARIAEALCDAQIIEADLTAGADSQNLEGVDVVFHLAAVGLHERVPRAPVEIAWTNVLITLNVLRLAAALGARRIVHVGSGLEYGEGRKLREDAQLAPTSSYGSSKAASWLLTHAFCREEQLEPVGLRPFTVYGPGDSPYGLVGSSVLAALAESDLALTEGRQTRDFVYVTDAVEAIVAAATSPSAVGEVFNVCTGVDTSIRAAVEQIVSLSGGDVMPRFGARPYRAQELWCSSGDPSKAAAVLGWAPTTGLEDGLAETIAWFRERSMAATDETLVR
jgi:UDP-glucose 4-epimerase